MGAYAVEYITSSSQTQRGYYEVALQIGYRRTAEQIQSVVNATSTEAIYSLLETALADGRTELAVRIGYWTQDGRERVAAAVSQLREDLGLSETPSWVVNYYPADGPVGLIEFLLDGEAAGQADGPADIPADTEEPPGTEAEAPAP